MNNLAKNFFFVSNVTLGLLIIFFIIYCRIFLTRMPKDLCFVYDNIINYGKFVFILISFVICIYILYKNILILIKKDSKENYFSKLFDKLNKIIEKALIEVYTLVMNSLFSDPYDIFSIIVDINNIFKKPTTNFNNDGFTKQDCLDMCKEHDRIAQDSKMKHPLTPDQEKYNEMAKEKQLQEKLAKKNINNPNDKNLPNSSHVS